MRNDGKILTPLAGGVYPCQGQMLFIPSSVPMPTGMSKTAEALWRAAQTYGVYVWDTAKVPTLRAENAYSFPTDPYPILGIYGQWGGLTSLNAGSTPFPFEALHVADPGFRK